MMMTPIKTEEGEKRTMMIWEEPLMSKTEAETDNQATCLNLMKIFYKESVPKREDIEALMTMTLDQKGP